MQKKTKLNKKVPMKKKGDVEDTKEKVTCWCLISWKGEVHQQAERCRSGFRRNQLAHATPHEGSGGAHAAVQEGCEGEIILYGHRLFCSWM